MPSIKELREKFNNKDAKPLLTPEQIIERDRRINRKRIAAARVARARAARYNMTLRSISIQSAKKMQDLHEVDREIKRANDKRHQEFNMTMRSLAIAVPRKALTSIEQALDVKADPTNAKSLVEMVAEHVAETEVDDNSEYELEFEPMVLSEEDKKEIVEHRKSIVQRMSSADIESDVESEVDEQEKRKSSVGKVLRKMSSAVLSIASKASSTQKSAEEKESNDSIPAEDDTEDDISEVSSIVISERGSGEFYMSSLANAIDSGDDNLVNRAILEEFLEEHDPDRLGEVDKLLEEYQGKEADLFNELTQQYPDPAEEAELPVGASFLETKVSFKEPEEIIRRKSSIKIRKPSLARTGSNKSNKSKRKSSRKKSVGPSTAELLRMEEQEEKERLANMEAEERKAEEARLAEEKKIEDEKAAKLKNELKIYSKEVAVSGGATRKKSTKSIHKPEDAPVPRKSLVQEGFILSGVQTTDANNNTKWAVNVQASILKERMLRAGATEAAIQQIQAEDSGML